MNDEICKVFAEAIFAIYNVDNSTGTIDTEGSYPPYVGVIENMSINMAEVLTLFYFGKTGKLPFGDITDRVCIDYFKDWYKNAYVNGDLT